jgi:hypothetical protein
MKGKKIRSGSHTPSLVARIYEPHFACIKAEGKVNLVVVCINLSKFKEPSKLLKGDLIPSPLGHPMKLPCISPLLNIQGGKELRDDLIIPILLERHDIHQVLGSTCSHYFIKDPVMLSLHIGLVNPLRNCYGLGLGNDDGLIEVMLNCRMKSIVNAKFLFQQAKSFLFSFLFAHQVSPSQKVGVPM